MQPVQPQATCINHQLINLSPTLKFKTWLLYLGLFYEK